MVINGANLRAIYQGFNTIYNKAFAEAEPQYPKTMGGRVWWREIWKEKGYRIQQNVVSGHFRLLDRENRRLMASFTLERVMERLKEELQ